MAEKSLLGVFGPTPEELQKLRAQQEQERSMFASRISPSYSAGYGLGTLLGGVVSSVFGLEDPELKKARDIKQIFNDLTAEGMTGDQAVMLDQLSYRLQEKGYGNESFTAATMANQARVNQQTLEEARLNAESLRSQREGQDLINRARSEDLNRQAAYNIGQGLKSLANSGIPAEKFDVAFGEAIQRLDKLGIDTTPLTSAEDREEQVAGIDYLINLGTTQKTRSAESIKQQQLELKDRMFTYQQYIDQEKLNVQKYGIESREGIAANNRIAAMERALATAGVVDKRLNAQLIGFEKSGRRQLIDSIDNKQNFDLAFDNLKSTYNLPLKEANKATEMYLAKVKDYLSEDDQTGFPKYTESKARALAQEDIAKVITKEGGILGIGQKSKVGNVKPNERAPRPDVFSTSQEAWITNAMKLNPTMSREDVIAQGKKLKKI